MRLSLLLAGSEGGDFGLKLANVALSRLVVLGLANLLLEGLDLLFYGSQFNPSAPIRTPPTPRPEFLNPVALQRSP